MSTDGFSRWKAPAGLLLLSALTRIFLAYRGGMSDPDSVAIAAGMARYFSPDASFGDIILYGRQANPGIYLVFRALYVPLSGSPSGVMAFLNALGVASAVLLPLPLYYIFRRSMNARPAAAAVLLFILAPLVWESGLSFHAVLPASLLLSLAWLAWGRIGGSPRGAAWLALTSLLASAALVMRLELLMLAPGILLSCILSRSRRRDITLLTAVAAAAIASHWLVLRLLPGAHATAGRSAADYASYISGAWLSSVRPAGIVRTSVWFAFGAGAATLVLALSGMSRGRKNLSDKKGIAVAIALILPTLLFWLPQPRAVILRHYFLIMPAVAWIAGRLFFRGMERRRLTGLVIAAVAVNLVLPEAAYFAWNRSRPGDAKTPHGTVFQYRAMMAGNIRRYHVMQSYIRLEAREAARRGGGDQGPAPAALVPVNWESYAYALYGMAQDGSLSELEEGKSGGGADLHRYLLGGSETRLVFSNAFTWDLLPDPAVPFMDDAAAEGFTTVVPLELEDSVTGILPPGAHIAAY